MSERPYDSPAFQHAVEYTVAVTFVVAGGKRRGTAERRCKRVAERIANFTARLADVVEVTAAGGFSRDGELSLRSPVRFAAANSGHGTYTEPGKLDRYLDCERDLALRALAADNAAAKARRDADRRRRIELGCRNAYQPLMQGERYCECAYCQPEGHLIALRRVQRGDPPTPIENRCLCGGAVAMAGQRCATHRDTGFVLLDGDPAPLQLLADLVSSA